MGVAYSANLISKFWLNVRQEFYIHCRMFYFGLFSGVWDLIANVSEHSVCSIFIGEWVRSVTGRRNWNEDGTNSFSETLAIKLHKPENNPKENIRHSRHCESLKSRIYIHYLYARYTENSLHSYRQILSSQFKSGISFWKYS
jgi:hypothetical protein